MVPESRIGRQRFLFEHIEPGLRNLAGIQRTEQRLRIDDRSTRRVHDNRARLHQRKATLVDQVSCLRKQRAVERDDVCFAAKRFQVDECYPEPRCHIGRDEWIARDQAQLPGGKLALQAAERDPPT